MNNKGQSLVSFVLLVPIIFLILWMVHDVASMVLLKSELNNINYMVVNYGLDHLDDNDIVNKLEELINKNKSGVNISVNIESEKLYVVISDHIDNKLSLFNKGKKFLISSSYVGYMEDEKKIIRKSN